MAASAKIGHNLAESADLINGFYPLLKRLQRLAADHLLWPLRSFERENRLDKSSGRAIDDRSGHL